MGLDSLSTAHWMLHEDEATLTTALVTGMVDLRLLPQSMRRLDDI